MTFQVSVSRLESFRMMKAEHWYSEAKLIAEIKEELVPTRKMEIGTAFGCILEKPDTYRTEDGFAYGEFAFPASVVDPCLAVFDRRGVFEVPHYTDWMVDGRQITTAARVDQLIGTTIQENKTKTGYFAPGMFDLSLQWRFYIPMYGAKAVNYNVFLLDDEEGKFSLRGIEHATYYPYPELHGECVGWLREFVEWAERKGLGPWLKPSWMRPQRRTA